MLTLGLSLGVVTTAFGLLAGSLGEAGASPEARVVLFQTEMVDGRESRARWPYAAVGLLREQAQSFEAIATYTTGTVNLAAGDEVVRADVEFVSPEYFDVAGVVPAAGRTFARASSEVAGAPAEVVIGHALWQRSFGGSPAAIGRTLRVSRIPLTIVGVMPEGFRGLTARAAIWVPHTVAPAISFDGDQFGASEASCRLRFHTQTGGVTLTAQSPLNNVVRVAIQALAATLGGTQSLHTNGYDEALSLPTREAATLALRTQQLVAYESGIANTVDPLAGSYFVEWLTDELERRRAGPDGAHRGTRRRREGDRGRVPARGDRAQRVRAPDARGVRRNDDRRREPVHR